MQCKTDPASSVTPHSRVVQTPSKLLVTCKQTDEGGTATYTLCDFTVIGGTQGAPGAHGDKTTWVLNPAVPYSPKIVRAKDTNGSFWSLQVYLYTEQELLTYRVHTPFQQDLPTPLTLTLVTTNSSPFPAKSDASVTLTLKPAEP